MGKGGRAADVRVYRGRFFNRGHEHRDARGHRKKPCRENHLGKLEIVAALIAGKFPEHKKGCPEDPDARRREGCDSDAEVPSYRIGGRDYYRCPYHYLDAELAEFLRAWKFYRGGMLPCAGGINDQPATFLDACSTLDAHIAEHEAEGLGGGE